MGYGCFWWYSVTTFLCCLLLPAMQQFQLPDEILPLFTVEVLEDRGKGKDHMPISKGERLSVILLAHPNLDPAKYLAEKDDGMSEPCDQPY